MDGSTAAPKANPFACLIMPQETTSTSSRMKLMMFLLTPVVFAPSIHASPASSHKLPVVDLGYNLHRATSFNSSGNFYNFSNIRYAAPPIGENRFRLPQPPEQDRSSVQIGLPDRICPQANPAWLNIADQFLALYLAGQTQFNESSFNTTSSGSTLRPQDPRTTEDCLFLDVVVPKPIFDGAGSGQGAAVLVWFYGGGYTTGSKSSWGNPAGLLARSEESDKQGIIYVSFNYRLGAFGWLSGPTFQEDGTSNAGLHDQAFALEWVRQYIHLFGGDPNRITVIGESAGGGSIMHQITAYGGNTCAAFQQAIIQSPGFFPIVSNRQQEDIFNKYLALLGVDTIDEARKLPFSQLQKANMEQVGASPYGLYTFGPAVDGDIVPALPGELLLHSQFAEDIRVMVGHNEDEGLLFTSPFVQTNTAFAEQVRNLAPTINAYPKALEYVIDTLFPPIFDGSQAQGYTSQVARAAAQISEMVFTCNTFYLDKAFGNKTHSYYFTAPPAIHGSDIPYTYYNGPDPMVLSVNTAKTLQKYITNFAETGDPNGPGVPQFPVYGTGATVLELNFTTSTRRDPAANWRCDWWQKALYS